jgi:hypothetical protein
MNDKEIADRFARDTAKHELTILHDDGLYRHLRFMAPRDSSYWFELITTPHSLTFRGDGESFVFSRLEDMFQFFRRSDGKINAHYWSEKLTSHRDSVMQYDPEIFTSRVKEYVVDAIRDGSVPRGIGRAVTTFLNEEAEILEESTARRDLADFQYGGRWAASCSCGASEEFGDDSADAYRWESRHRRDADGTGHWTQSGKKDVFEFSDVWEWSFRDYDWWFLWALHGIVWGIAQYDLAKQAAPVAVGGAL